jgi:hypothetical protein
VHEKLDILDKKLEELHEWLDFMDVSVQDVLLDKLDSNFEVELDEQLDWLVELDKEQKDELRMVEDMEERLVVLVELLEIMLISDPLEQQELIHSEDEWDVELLLVL